MARAAFFDLDKTLVPGSSLFLLARGLYRRDVFRVRDIVRFGVAQARFRLSGAEQEEGSRMARDTTLTFVTGRSQAELRSWGQEIARERIIPEVYPGMVHIVDRHRRAGSQTFLVTAAPVELAEIVATALGMTGALGTRGELDEFGNYTGRLEGELLHGPAKARAVRALAAERDIDLAASAAYSDSVNDLPLLEAVGEPHAVNPDSELAAVAREQGWPLHELRTRRLAVLIGIPAGLGGAVVFGAGVAVGMAAARRRAAD
ncbi:MAG: HAD-IB family hydrolase [Actinomycetota bacterium]|nr:HAD-IB family hydrolase [Actinomycetota bacterium]